MSQVDVIIPCYKYGHFLRQCVESVLGQQRVEVRVLILDDASPDHTPEIATELVRTDRRVEYRRHAVNQGNIATYNEGFSWASGKYTVLFSADDVMPPGALWRAARLMDAHPEVGLTYGRQLIFKDGQPLPNADCRCEGYGQKILAGLEFLRFVCSTGSNPVPAPTISVRTDWQHKLGGYLKELPHSADLEICLRFAAHTSIGMVDALQAYRRYHGKNMIYNYLGLPDYRQRKATFDFMLRNYGHLIPGCDELHQMAIRNLAGEAFWAASAAFDGADVTRCNAILDFVGNVCPEFRSRPEWSRMRWKRRMGPLVWRVLRPLLDRLRGRPVTSAR